MEKFLDKLQKAIVSTRTMAMLLLVYAASMAVATFVENDYGTPTAKALIYEAKWFELVMLLLMINFIGNIKRYQLYKRGKWPLLVFHLSFILIFIGGAITRYISFEGVMNIREGKTSRDIVSEKQYFKIQIEEKGDVLNYQDVPYIFSPLHHGFKASYQFRNKKVEVRALNYLQRKKDSLILDNNGQEYLHMVSAGESGRINYYLAPGDVKSINGTLVAYNREIEGAVQVSNQNGVLKIKTPENAKYLTMAADSKMEFSTPYMTAPTCLSYLASKVPNPVESWAMLDRTDLKGRITLLDDMREVLGAALKLLGHSLNSTVPAELAAARDVAIRWKKNIAKFENEQYKTGIASGEFVLVQGYAGDLIQASEENEDMRIFIPKEGAAFSCDDLCIPKGAAQADLAHAFINYVTGPEVAAENMEWIGYRAPNSGAYSLLSEDFRGSPVLFPPDELFAKCEPIADLADKLPLWTAEWDKVKTS